MCGEFLFVSKILLLYAITHSCAVLKTFSTEFSFSLEIMSKKRFSEPNLIMLGTAILERCRRYIPPLSSHILDSLQPCMSHDIKVAARSTDWGSDYEVPSNSHSCSYSASASDSASYSYSASVQGDEAEIVILTPQRAPGAVEDPGVGGERRQIVGWGRVRVSWWAIYQLCQSMPGTAQGQTGTSRDKAGRSRDKAGTNRDKQGQTGAFPFSPC